MKKVRLKQADKARVQIAVNAVVLFSVLFSLLSVFITVLNSLKYQYDIYTGIFSLPTAGIAWSNFSTAFGVVSGYLLPWSRRSSRCSAARWSHTSFRERSFSEKNSSLCSTSPFC